MLLNIIYLLAGFIILVYGANLLVDGGAALAHRLKVPNIVIGLTVVAFGTSTPELVVNIISSIEGSSALALGNVLGSNIFNIMAILGVTALFVPIGIKRSTTWIEISISISQLISVSESTALMFFNSIDFIPYLRQTVYMETLSRPSISVTDTFTFSSLEVGRFFPT